MWLGVAPVSERMEAVAKVLNLPDDKVAYSLFPMGYPAEEGKQQDRFDEARIHYVS